MQTIKVMGGFFPLHMQS